MLNGNLIKDLPFIPEARREEVTRRAEYLRIIFERNAYNCGLIGISIEKQRRELVEYYGIKVSFQIMSQLKNGRRYRVGFALIMAIRDYWEVRGIPFSLDK